ncbi:mannosyltransferase [Pseudomonas sp. HMSC08G10]|uniref:dermonecrotic toxin domain-containing protein n=1 Tax=Pseudomonas sp. HMSC08G10 TaxID=1581141 RepID=UPI0008A34F31|nr:DUF6543 domain-containing protein [Pseudomonas sp. HMSC08G10]OFS69224.1 mannosyltransferase [Pseudomonas sp. HMSC08G10]
MTPSYVNDAGVQFVRDHLANVPRPDRAAAQAIRQWAGDRGLDVNPDRCDVVVLHHQWRPGIGRVAVVTQKMTLTQAVLSNWQGESANDLIGAALGAPWAGVFPDDKRITLVDHLDPPSALANGPGYGIYNGLFRQATPQKYSRATHIQLPAEAFERFIWALDFHASYRAMLDRYWSAHLQGHRTSAKIAFIAACNKQAAEGSLSDAARQLAWQAAGLASAKGSIQVRLLNVYGYVASHLPCIRDTRSGLTLLYMPGNSAPLLEFASEGLMQDWFAEQCKDAAKRQALRQFFSLQDTPDGLGFSGLDTALAGLGAYPSMHRLSPQRAGFTRSGYWAPREYVNYHPDHYSPVITGDLFTALSEQQRQRSYADADFIITSDNEVSKARWRDYLTCTMNLLTPLTFVIPGLAPMLAVGGVAQFGLGLDQIIHGRTQEQQASGVQTLTYGLFNALPLASQGLSRGAELFRVKSEGFVTPSWINERWGYPLSPVDPPRLPQTDVAPYFHIPAPIPALPDGDPAIIEAVTRTPRYSSSPDQLSARIDGHRTQMIYDTKHDAFVKLDSLNEVDPVRYVARTGSTDLVPVAPGREVSNATRPATLRALGVDLPLPVELPSGPGAGASPIPPKVSCIWLGDKVIEPKLLTNLASNAARLRDSRYTLRLYLSKATPAAYAQNLRQLTEHAPGLEVVPLEEQPFFRTFSQGSYYAQYQAAIDGNAGMARHYASACDVLRFSLLYQEGGLYMDVDDYLLAPGEYPRTLNGKPLGKPGESIDQVELLATGEGLLLAPPMANEKMSMYCLYNTSLIGSHAGNPTLLAISEEMRARYLAEPDFYDRKPSLAEDPAGFYRYAERLSHLTGPALLTEVVDQRLPALRTLRQVMHLHGMPVDSDTFIDLDAYRQALRTLLPLNRIARVGSYNSWARA